MNRQALCLRHGACKSELIPLPPGWRRKHSTLCCCPVGERVSPVIAHFFKQVGEDRGRSGIGCWVCVVKTVIAPGTGDRRIIWLWNLGSPGSLLLNFEQLVHEGRLWGSVLSGWRGGWCRGASSFSWVGEALSIRNIEGGSILPGVEGQVKWWEAGGGHCGAHE